MILDNNIRCQLYCWHCSWPLPIASAKNAKGGDSKPLCESKMPSITTPGIKITSSSSTHISIKISSTINTNSTNINRITGRLPNRLLKIMPSRTIPRSHSGPWTITSTPMEHRDADQLNSHHMCRFRNSCHLNKIHIISYKYMRINFLRASPHHLKNIYGLSTMKAKSHTVGDPFLDPIQLSTS